MERFIGKSALALLLLCLNSVVAAPAFAQEKAGAGVADIAQMQGPNRRQALIDGAKKEGEVTVYAVNPGMAKIAAEFTKKYGVKVNLWRASSENVLQRVVTEGRAGRAELDVVQNSSPEIEATRREKLLQAVNSPYLADVIPQAVPANKEWVGYAVNEYVQAYNTNKIKKEDLPKSYQDLLDPKWKGKLGIEQEDYSWFAGVLKQVGQEKGLKLFKDIIATNDISVRKGHTLLGQMVASGEVPLALTLYSYNPDQMKEKGAPVEGFVIGQPIAVFQSIAIMKKAPHPNAAVLFYDFMLSDAQQMIYDDHGVATARKFEGVLKTSSMIYIDPAAALDQGAKWAQIYNDVFMKRGR
ncbi:extracellular solute-binding protein [Oxalobacteraceae bacterium CAVE-383]|nr:extracellular solute-binding protein [Oxalobacteraceae bacterium CAVE-383]